MDVFKSCLCCLKQVDGSKKCGRCRTASYCSVECQKQHWKVHKNNCKDSNIDGSVWKLPDAVSIAKNPTTISTTRATHIRTGNSCHATTYRPVLIFCSLIM